MSEGLKVLFVGPYYVPGILGFVTGKHISYVFRDLYDAIELYCEKIFMLTSAYIPEQVKEEFAGFPKLHVIQTEKGPAFIHNGLMNHYYLIREGIRFVRNEKIDVVSITTGESNYGFDMSVIARLTGVRSVLRVPGDSIMTSIRTGRYNTWRRPLIYLDRLRRFFAYRWADAVIVMTPAERERVVKFVSDPRKIYVCPRGVDTERFSSSTGQRGGKNVFNVLYIGKQSKAKGVDIALSAARLLEDHPGVRFTFVGGFEEGVSGNITFMGPVHVSKIHDMYMDSDVVIMPSRNEGLPQVLLEAMSSGKAIIASKNIFGKLVPDNAVMLCENTPDAFADKIRHLIENPDSMERLGVEARAFAEKEYDKKRFQALYRDIIYGNV
jgi:glycosyltransferase involved in cell wall biosynthesis